jgi:DNA-binding CsgD family transcriptional regulator
VADGSHSSHRHEFASRRPELTAVRELLRAAAAGRGGTLVIRGEAGIGKTELLEQALDAEPALRRIGAIGREFETELAFTALQDLCRPVLTGLESLPGPQRAALEVALALREDTVPDPLRIGLAVLGLLAATARKRPIVCLIDDAQWLDHASAQVLSFVARRVEGQPVAFLVAMRDPAGTDPFDGLPTRTLTGIGHDDALALLAARVRVPLDERIRQQIVAEAHGNPLALLELPRHARAAVLAGGFGLPDALPVPERIEAAYRRSLDALPAPTRTLLLLAAAEPLGDPTLLWKAAERLGVTADAAGPAEAAGLLDLGVRVQFRHPLVRSAVYRAATPPDRRAAHHALADATDPDADPDRRAWHRGQSVVAPDESVAGPLERSAEQAYARGGMAAAARFLDRAAALTPDPARRAARLLEAAGYMHRSGDIEAARRLLATAEAGPLDERRRALAALLAGQIAALPGRAEAPSLLFGAARGLEAHDRPRAYETYLEAVGMAVRTGRLGDQGLLTKAARAARAALAQDPPDRATRPLDLLLGALTTQVTEGQVSALPLMRAAIDAFVNEADGPGKASHWMWLANSVAIDLGDEEASLALSEREVWLTRRSGALIALPIALGNLAVTRIYFGQLAEAAALIDEAHAVNEDETAAVSSWVEIPLAAWRGEAERVAELAESGAPYVRDRGVGIVLTMFDHATALVHNATGRYDVALRAGRSACHADDLGYRLVSPPELIEAAARSGQPRLAEPVLRQLVERTDASGTDLALGLQYRCRALLSTGSEAEKLYRQAIDRLEHTRAAGHLARAHLLYGEWLRREARRGDARDQLRVAHEMLARMGIAGFAARAARELAACGERPRRRADDPLDLLTAQERRIAVLVADGATSKEAAAQLFLSPRTVDAHLRSIFKKLDLTSRRQLRDLRSRL